MASPTATPAPVPGDSGSRVRTLEAAEGATQEQQLGEALSERKVATWGTQGAAQSGVEFKEKEGSRMAHPAQQLEAIRPR